MPMKFSLMQIYHFILSHKYSEMWKKKKKTCKMGCLLMSLICGTHEVSEHRYYIQEGTIFYDQCNNDYVGSKDDSVNLNHLRCQFWADEHHLR